MDINTVSKLSDALVKNISKVIYGKEQAIKYTVNALLSGGHVLLEDVPGTGKTMLAKALAKSVRAKYARVQFTPDLLPGDLTGVDIYDRETGRFMFREGPVFTDILLADEINRATPRTQSALLEAMEERQVTAGGESRPLSDGFFAIATQNPVETQGTFPLPEAQLDRFLMKLTLGYPDTEASKKVLTDFVASEPVTEIQPVCKLEDILAAREVCRSVKVAPIVVDYTQRILEASRDNEDIELGVSTRGGISIIRCAQTLAAQQKRDFVTPDDIREMCVPVLAHRLILRSGLARTGGTTAAAIRSVVNGVKVPTEQVSR